MRPGTWTLGLVGVVLAVGLSGCQSDVETRASDSSTREMLPAEGKTHFEKALNYERILFKPGQTSSMVVPSATGSRRSR